MPYCNACECTLDIVKANIGRFAVNYVNEFRYAVGAYGSAASDTSDSCEKGSHPYQPVPVSLNASVLPR